MESDNTQHERFKAKAEELECDDDSERFNAALRKIAATPKGEQGQSEKKDGE